MGSGTAVIVASRMGRNAIGIEILTEYFKQVEEKTMFLQTSMFEESTKYAKAQSS